MQLTGMSLTSDNRFRHTGKRINIQLKFNIKAEPRAVCKPFYKKKEHKSKSHMNSPINVTSVINIKPWEHSNPKLVSGDA